MEVDCCLPGTVDSESLDPRQDSQLPDLPNLLTVPPGSYGSGIRHRQERLFCRVCQQFLEEPCWFHAKSVPNESVVPFALASLHKILHLDVCANSSTGKKVVANARIPPQTVFGPLVAPLTEKYSDTCVYAFRSAEDGQLRFFQLDSELFSNWMRYVRFAENLAEENLAVYLRGSQIVFVSVRNILPGEELKVCYSAKYAQFIGRSDGQSGRAGNESFCMTALEFAEHSENILPQNPPQTPNSAGDWDSDSSRTLLTEKDGSALPALQAFPYALLITPLTVHNVDEGDSVTPPSKRRCPADTTATVASPLASQESADLQMDDYGNASSLSLTGSGSLPSVKTRVIREDSPEIEYHSIVKTPNEWCSKEEPKASTETVLRRSTLRSAAKEVVPVIVDTCDDNEGGLTGRFHVETDSDWSPENDETCDGNDSDDDDCDMNAEQNSGRIKDQATRKAKSGRMAPFRSNGPPDGGSGSGGGDGVTGGRDVNPGRHGREGSHEKKSARCATVLSTE
ncbi:uncharacterized protein LOC129602414 [Paramacrobiotus metropolitanus]|uniref:uncharacterized protein LOC129602414 n=1 Tax=Paramacrobiotus metropolitanus TaxID=2943436 RepID=UPI002446065C|nr:uncharacterized protein LOC129602414 [Paramacrobiotus metropolitanus]